MFERFKNAFHFKGEKKHLMHVAVTMHGIEQWAEEHKKPLKESYKKSFGIINEIIEQQVKRDIPIITFFLLPEEGKKEEQFPTFIDAFIEFFNSLSENKLIHKNKVKISALGKWYSMPGRAVEPIKKIIEETKEYDGFFLNFCINYNGQEEIVDACRIIARQIQADKIDIDTITKETIKDNIYASYFMPLDLIIKNGRLRKTAGLLLWDSPDAEIHFTEKNWPDFNSGDFLKAVESCRK